MKKSILTLAILLNLSFQNDRQAKTLSIFNGDLEHLNGHVRQIIEINDDHTTEAESPLIITTIVNFDKHGNTILERKKNFWDKKWSEIKYFNQYDANGKKTKTITKSIENGTQIYLYGRDGNISESSDYWLKHKLVGKTIYKYNNIGNIVERVTNGGEEHYRFEYKYNTQVNLISEEEFYQNGSRIKTINEYKSFDEKGNWLKKIRIEHVNRSGLERSAYPADTITRKITYY